MMKKRRAKNRKMGKFESFAEYLNNLLGANFFVKYYSNKSVDWEAVINEKTCHGSMKVIGGSNQSLKDIYTRTDDISLTFMIPEELFEERSTEVDRALSSIDKQLISINSEYIQFIYSYRADIGQTIYNGKYYSSVTFNFSLVSFVDLFMSDDQYVELTWGNTLYRFKGLSSVTYQYAANYDGSVNQAGKQKNYLASYNETLVLSGLVVANDTAREKVEEFRTMDRDFTLKYHDGNSFVMVGQAMKLASYTRIGISGSLLKYEFRFVQKG